MSATTQDKPLITKVEHFFLVSNDTERLFRFFKNEFQLPLLWPFQSYGDFASGGLSLGNVVMEFLSVKGSNGAEAGAEFKGIAFEPVADSDGAVVELNNRSIPHSEPQPYKFTQDGQERVGWVTIKLEGLPPSNANIFICDYKLEFRQRYLM